MNKNEFMEGIHILQNNYNQKFSTEKLKLYYENLKEMSQDSYIKNIKKLIKTNKFMPNVAEILGKTERLSNFEARDYTNFDFNSLLANRDILV
jgi:hypothetical protein